MDIEITREQQATLLAALNAWIADGKPNPAERTEIDHIYATDDDCVISLDERGCDELFQLLDGEYRCQGCSRKEAECSADPCSDVLLDRVAS